MPVLQSSSVEALVVPVTASAAPIAIAVTTAPLRIAMVKVLLEVLDIDHINGALHKYAPRPCGYRVRRDRDRQSLARNETTT
ncbi:hypothetical protein [Saccharomonospora azurea]|uniref:hypothetical protein n=1 Tax=Saccharomonospora azurea TaxID=40988 RepID=UPI00159CFEE6|nr:hypothetical protein [Saccharomonospora azurea]